MEPGPSVIETPVRDQLPAAAIRQPDRHRGCAPGTAAAPADGGLRARGAIGLALLLAIALVACSRSGENNGTATPEHAITAFDASEAHVGARIHDLNRAAAADPAALRKAALLHLHDGSPAVRYAALYGLMLTATAHEGSTELAAMLPSANLDERLLSAATLAGIGDKRGLPVLIDALDNPEQLRFRDPPQPAFTFARAELLWLTDADLGLKTAPDLDAAKVAAAKPAWRLWWQENQATLHMDAQKRRFVP